jgi:hypothetical protein
LVVVVVVAREMIVLVTVVFLWFSHSNEFDSILVSKYDIHFQLVVEATIKIKLLFSFNYLL